MNPGGKNVPKYLTFLRLAWTKASQKSLKIAAGMFVQGLRLGWGGFGMGSRGWWCWGPLGLLGWAGGAGRVLCSAEHPTCTFGFWILQGIP